MFATIKQIFNPKNRDLQKRILFTLGAFFIFKVGVAIIVPGINPEKLGTNNLGFLQLINVMGGGAMEKFSIFSLGVMPYITASIVIQLLQMDIIPYFSELAKQGHTGRTKLNTITRYLGIALAFIQGYMFAYSYVPDKNVWTYMQIAVVLTAGTSFLLWMADQITIKGFGNGTSMIIMAGIVSNIPTMFTTAWNDFVNTPGNYTTTIGIILFIVFVLLYFGIVLGIVFEQLTERRIAIQYSNRSSGVLGKQNYIPFKLNTANVVPVIFASSIISMFGMIAQFVKKDGFTIFVNNWISTSSITGFIIYIFLIIIFSYFYTFMQVKPKELADDLQKNGGYIPAVRPGKETVDYIYGVLNRITVVGALFLSVIAGLPIIFGLVTKVSPNVQVGGTGLIIVVGVALESYKQLESRLVSRNYTKESRRR